MAARTLRTSVVLRHPDTGETTTVVGGSVPPAWAVPLITNPDAWADDAAVEQDAGTPRPPRRRRGTAVAAEPAAGGPGGG